MASTKWYSVTEAAEHLGLEVSGLRRYCAEGRLGRKVGKSYIISHAELERFAAIPRPPGRPPKDSER